MAPITIHHNPRCSKSRKALEILREAGHEPEVVEYLKSPPSAEQVLALVRALDIPAHDLLRAKEAPYGELGLSAESSDAEIAEAIAQQPILLERPVIVKGDRAVIGRPPERVRELL